MNSLSPVRKKHSNYPVEFKIKMVRTLVQSRSQPAFILAFHHQMPWYALNILFVFASVTQLLALHYRLGNRGIFFGGIILAVIVTLLAGSLVVVFSPSSPVDTLLFAMIPTLVFPAVVAMLVRDHVSDKVQRFMPRHFFYFAYAGHLLLAGMLLL